MKRQSQAKHSSKDERCLRWTYDWLGSPRTVIYVWVITEARLYALNVVHRKSQSLMFVVRDVNGASGRLTRVM